MTDRYEEATSATFRDEDIARAKALVEIGDLPRKLDEHLTTAMFDAIRNFATGYGDDNPLYCDEAYGEGTRWGSQIAPPLIGVAVGKALRGDPPDPAVKRPSFRGIHAFVSGTAWEFYRPVLPATPFAPPRDTSPRS